MMAWSSWETVGGPRETAGDRAGHVPLVNAPETTAAR